MRLLLVTVILALTACGRSPATPSAATADASFNAPLLQGFHDMAARSSGFQASIDRLKAGTLTAPALSILSRTTDQHLEFSGVSLDHVHSALKQSTALALELTAIDQTFSSVGQLLDTEQANVGTLTQAALADFLRGGDQTHAVTPATYQGYIARQINTLLLLTALAQHADLHHGPANLLDTSSRVGTGLNFIFTGFQVADIIGHSMQLHSEQVNVWNREIDKATSDVDLQNAAKRNLLAKIRKAQQTAPDKSLCTRAYIDSTNKAGNTPRKNPSGVAWDCLDNIPNHEPHWEASLFIGVL